MNVDVLTAFFQAENTRNWERYAEYLHSQVVWTLHTQPVRTVTGRAAYVAAMQAAYAGSDSRFVCAQQLVSADGQRIAAVLVNQHGQRSVDIFQFADGLIVREDEFLLD